MKGLAALALLVMACGQQTASSPTSSPAATPMVCRLAVIQGGTGQGSGLRTPGFLTLPGQAFAPATDAGDRMFYDKPLKQWVPWGGPSLSADGKRYAYAEFLSDTKMSKIHLVDVLANSDVVEAAGGPWVGVGLEGNAFYVMRIEFMSTVAYGNIEVGKGLWKVPLDGGAPTQLTSDARHWAWVANGGVYGDASTVDVAGGPNDVVRYDLRSGQVTTLFDVHQRSRVLSVDATGAALIVAEADQAQVWRAPQAGSAVQVWSGATDGPVPEGPVAVDGTDVWLSGSSLRHEWAIYHYSLQNGMQQAASFTDRPVTVAGPCA